MNYYISSVYFFIQHPGDLIQYQSEGSGEVAKLTSAFGVLAMKNLCLKRGCPVMLLHNISNRLVNGSTGVVVDLDETGPKVHFPDADVTLEMQKHTFTG